MIKLTACYSLKLPADVEFSSEQAGATVEIELSDEDAAQIPAKLKNLWSMLKQSVEAELERGAGGGGGLSQGNGSPPNGATRLSGGGNNGFGNGASNAFGQGNGGGNGSHGNGNGAHGNGAYTGNGPGSPATRKQIGLLLALARRNRNWNATQTKDAVKQHYHCDLNSLTKSQASQIIDQLQAKAMN